MISPKQQLHILIDERKFGKAKNAPLDSMGGFVISTDTTKENIKDFEKQKRFHYFIKLILSPQTKDQVTHATYLALIDHLGDLSPINIINTKIQILEEILKPCLYYRTKTKNLVESCRIMIENYNGDLPSTLSSMLTLPGVGKKIAILAMKICWKQVCGVSVDTHVHRISNRLGWANSKTPEKTRIQLESLFDIEDWEYINWTLVGYGQTVCKSRSPSCSVCKLKNSCKYYQNIQNS